MATLHKRGGAGCHGDLSVCAREAWQGGVVGGGGSRLEGVAGVTRRADSSSLPLQRRFPGTASSSPPALTCLQPSASA
ncbi:hypothetical protein PR048_033054 [Dryococelus australis]|uniref:Arginine vasotocin receptor n=1 Tax=Dryococelus australis TaxID=614101 RepID=A0ABQ9FZ52_9NEOP|nr:hypothetical protein PR048_033054 [Dryococelus australis]